jgi:hypothetical protein
MKERHLLSCGIAGFTYYDGVDVYNDLKIGTELILEAEPSNRYDADAVAIYYKTTKLGYIPKDENCLISQFLNLGYNDIFEVKINRISAEAHPEKQISIQIRIRKKNKEAEAITGEPK